MHPTPELLQQIFAIASDAGSAILDVYHSEEGPGTTNKADNSPVTRADLAANEIVQKGLIAIAPEIPVLSEESSLPEYALRSRWSRYWLVDPLDGTREFIKRNGEFTVNIALIEHGIPVLGVVHAPVLDLFYGGIRGQGAFKVSGNAKIAIRTRHLSERAPGKPVTVFTSRSHGSAAVEACLASLENAFGNLERTYMGSSLKLCLIAEGSADFYPRMTPTSEWDIAAAHAVVDAAGGAVLNRNLQPLKYNTKADMLNPDFYVVGDPAYHWARLLQI